MASSIRGPIAARGEMPRGVEGSFRFVEWAWGRGGGVGPSGVLVAFFPSIVLGLRFVPTWRLPMPSFPVVSLVDHFNDPPRPIYVKIRSPFLGFTRETPRRSSTCVGASAGNRQRPTTNASLPRTPARRPRRVLEHAGEHTCGMAGWTARRSVLGGRGRGRKMAVGNPVRSERGSFFFRGVIALLSCVFVGFYGGFVSAPIAASPRRRDTPRLICPLEFRDKSPGDTLVITHCPSKLFKRGEIIHEPHLSHPLPLHSLLIRLYLRRGIPGWWVSGDGVNNLSFWWCLHVQTQTPEPPRDLAEGIEGPMLLEPASKPRPPLDLPQDSTLSHNTQLSRDITTATAHVSEQRTDNR